MVRGVVSARNGSFTLKNVKKGSYLLHITFIGYDPLYQPGNYVESQVLKSQLGDYYKDFSLLKNIKERAMIQARVPFELNVK